MLFKIMSFFMLAIAAMFILNVDPEHAMSAALIPAGAALGLLLLGSS